MVQAFNIKNEGALLIADQIDDSLEYDALPNSMILIQSQDDSRASASSIRNEGAANIVDLLASKGELQGPKHTQNPIVQANFLHGQDAAKIEVDQNHGQNESTEDLRDGFAGVLPEKVARNRNNIRKGCSEVESNKFAPEEEEKSQKDGHGQEGNCQELKAFSVSTFCQNKRMDELNNKYPHLWHRYVEHLRFERDQLLLKQHNLELNGKVDSREYRDYSRSLWVTNGSLEHNLDPCMLQEIIKKYYRIDAVPNHYHLPELYQSLTKAPIAAPEEP